MEQHLYLQQCQVKNCCDIKHTEVSRILSYYKDVSQSSTSINEHFIFPIASDLQLILQDFNSKLFLLQVI